MLVVSLIRRPEAFCHAPPLIDSKTTIAAAVAAALTLLARIAVIDQIMSPSALVLSIAEIVRLCRSAGQSSTRAGQPTAGHSAVYAALDFHRLLVAHHL